MFYLTILFYRRTWFWVITQGMKSITTSIMDCFQVLVFIQDTSNLKPMPEFKIFYHQQKMLFWVIDLMSSSIRLIFNLLYMINMQWAVDWNINILTFERIISPIQIPTEELKTVIF